MIKSNRSTEVNLSTQRFIHQVQINGVLALQRRKARETRKKMGFRYAPEQQNRNQQQKFIDNIKRRQIAKQYTLEKDVTARQQARKFLQKVRSLKLVELPELSYFRQMIERSCSKDKQFRRKFDTISGRRSTMSCKSYTRTDNNSLEKQKQKPVQLPRIRRIQRHKSKQKDSQNMSSKHIEYVKLKTLLDNYERSTRRIKTQQIDQQDSNSECNHKNNFI